MYVEDASPNFPAYHTLTASVTHMFFLRTSLEDIKLYEYRMMFATELVNST